MSDRYTTLLSVKNPRWSIHSPILIEKGALIKDSFTNNNLLHFQIKNIGAKVITALNISIDCIDVINNSVSEKVDYSYLDLNVKSNDSFGNNIPIILNKIDSREFIVTINKIIFEDGSKFETYLVLHEIELPQSINALGDLKNQFLTNVAKVSAAIKVTTLPQEYDNYWYCVCGAFNNKEDKCRKCGCERDALISLSNIQELQKKHDNSENQKIEDLRILKEKRKRKIKRFVIITPILLLLILGVVFGKMEIQNSMAYENALKLVGAAEYDNAINELNKLGEYKDSENLITMAKYEKGQELLDEKKYDDAYQLFYDLGDYKDSEELKSESQYQRGIELLEANDIQAADVFFKQLGAYKDSKQYVSQCEKLIAEAHSANQNNTGNNTEEKANSTVANANDNANSIKQNNTVQVNADEKDVADFINLISGTWKRPYDSGMSDQSGIITFTKVGDSHISFSDDAVLHSGNVQNVKVIKLVSLKNCYYFECKGGTGRSGDGNGNIWDYYLINRYAVTIVDQNTVTIKGSVQSFGSDGREYCVGNTFNTFSRQ